VHVLEEAAATALEVAGEAALHWSKETEHVDTSAAGTSEKSTYMGEADDWAGKAEHVDTSGPERSPEAAVGNL
jgi:hypothetical protein